MCQHLVRTIPYLIARIFSTTLSESLSYVEDRVFS
uniref:Uncharacterized protein n=1 Tax=Parascaris equorum TaxID=6256 RepID=A0A914REY8_PAREQ